MDNAMATTQSNEAQFIMIGDTRIEIKDGLYSLNDLHKASNTPASKIPSKWLSNKATQEFLSTTRIRVLVQNGGAGTQGTFAPKMAVYAYAMWISPTFQMQVMETFDAVVTGKLQPLALTQDQQLVALAQGVIKLTAERDEAIKTKALIGSKREATAMATASAATKRVKKLEAQVQNEGSHISLIASKLPERIDTEVKQGAQTWRVLKKISNEMGLSIEEVHCQRWGKAKVYHVDVIAEFKRKYITDTPVKEVK